MKKLLIFLLLINISCKKNIFNVKNKVSPLPSPIRQLVFFKEEEEKENVSLTNTIIEAEQSTNSEECAGSISKNSNTLLSWAIQFYTLDKIIEILNSIEDINVIDKDGKTPLIRASEFGRTQIVELLLERGANPFIACNTSNEKENGKNALMYAIENNHLGIVKLLLQKFPSLINIPKEDGWTALTIAAYKGHYMLAYYLLNKKDNKAEINVLDENNKTPLIWASGFGHTRIVELLLEKDADPFIACYTSTGISKEKNALMYASEHNHLDVVKLLLQKFPSLIDKNQKDGWTSLMYASKNGNRDVVEYLLKKGAKDFYDEDGKTALVYAIENNKLNLVDLFLSYSYNKQIALNYAIKICNLELIKMLLQNSDVNTVEKDDENPLIWASIYGHLNVTKLLLDNGFYVDEEDNNKKTPLMHAIENGHSNVTELLLNCNANVNIADINGKTPLMCASEDNNLNIIKLLLHFYADINEIDESGYTALIYAASKGYYNVVKYLLESGAEDFCDENGKTLLMYAGENNHLDIVKLLLYFYADINQVDENGETVLIYAAKNNNSDVVKYLLESGAEDFCDNNGKTALVYAIENNYENIIQILFNNQLSLIRSIQYAIADAEETEFKTFEKKQCLKKLINMGVKSNLVLENGNTLLEEASNNEVIKQRIFSDNPDIIDRDGQTLLMREIIINETITDTIMMLLEEGANVNTITDNNGYTALNYALESENKYLITLLEKQDMVCDCLENMSENEDRYSLIEEYIKVLVDNNISEEYIDRDGIIEVIDFLEDNNFPDSEIIYWNQEIQRIDQNHIYDV